jgi:hypothetical protein
MGVTWGGGGGGGGGPLGSPTDPLLAGGCGPSIVGGAGVGALTLDRSFSQWASRPAKPASGGGLAVALGRLRAFGAFLLGLARDHSSFCRLVYQVEYADAVDVHNGAAQVAAGRQ